jgi:adenylate kinase family enzyme
VRVSVIGSSGAGKTTFGRKLSARLGAPFFELDAIYHLPGWCELSDEEFRARVSEATTAGAWVCDGNYSVVRPMVWERATDVVWIDPPKAIVMAQVVSRSLSRAVTGRELWNGNRERMRTWLDPAHPIRWAWSQYDRKRAEYPARLARPEYAHLRLHRLHSRRQARRFLAEI